MRSNAPSREPIVGDKEEAIAPRSAPCSKSTEKVDEVERELTNCSRGCSVAV